MEHSTTGSLTSEASNSEPVLWTEFNSTQAAKIHGHPRYAVSYDCLRLLGPDSLTAGRQATRLQNAQRKRGTSKAAAAPRRWDGWWRSVWICCGLAKRENPEVIISAPIPITTGRTVLVGRHNADRLEAGTKNLDRQKLGLEWEALGSHPIDKAGRRQG